MKLIAQNILNTLTKQDYINIVASHSEYWTEKGEYHNYSPNILSCKKKGLVPASTSHKKQLSGAIDELKPQGGSNHV